jgi:hypothetical protein
MNLQLILGILNALLSAIPQITNAKTINQIVAWLLQLEPVIVQFYTDLGPIISNVIAALSANPATTATQIATLKQLDAKVDASFDDAFASYLASHPDPVTALMPAPAQPAGDAPVPFTPAPAE